MKGSETIRVIRKPRVDKLKPASGPTAEFDVPDCIVIPRASYEEGRGWVQLSGFSVYAPPNADVRAEDQVLCRGFLHEVEGVPGLLKNGRGRDKKLSFTLGRAS